MKPRLARALLVVAVFAGVATITATTHYLADTGQAPPPASAKPLDQVFWGAFRYYLAWALCTPAIFWLARKVPIVGGRWFWPVAFHMLVPVVAALPFYLFRVLLNSALTLRPPPLAKVLAAWPDVFPVASLAVLPIYWFLLAAGSALQVQRDAEAQRVQATHLQRSLADAQLDGLRMKLQPHFLFNTLNAIGALAGQDDTEGVVQMVDHLGTLLRLSMETGGRQLVALDEDLRVLDAYLAIEEVRHRDRLSVVRRIEPGAGQRLVPSLILQPLVENAVAHGLGGRIDASIVEIGARRAGDRLELSVRDDGPGLPRGWTLARGAGRGLTNVIDRLRALYGDDASLEVVPGPGTGTISRLLLPLRQAAPPAASAQGPGLFERNVEERAAWTA